MRIGVLNLILLAVAVVMTFSLTHGQDRAPRRVANGQRPATAENKSSSPVPVRSPHAETRDFSKLGVLQKEMLVSCQRGANWLFQVNGVKGHFVNGYLPALNTEMKGGNFSRQAGAAFALARAAAFLNEKRYAARAAQAILTLLDETTVDAKDPSCRHIALPSIVVNRLGAASLLVLAINELPAPQPDLLTKSEQLCNWIRGQARSNGSLRTSEAEDKDDSDSVQQFAGLALYAVVRSQKHKPAQWKTELLRKAATYYRSWWKAHRSMDFVPWQTAAYVEAYLRSKEAIFADFVFDMNDWLCRLQYDRLDPQRLNWYGGFLMCHDGKAVDAPPSIVSARYTASLAEACRAARAASDPIRHQRYTESVERGLQFVVRLQYTNANTQHFADWYRPRLLGAFHASFQDGNLRIDYVQDALSALIAYLLESTSSG